MRALVRRLTEVSRHPLVPEIRVLAAPEPVPVWEATEAFSGQREGPPFWAHPWPGGLALARWVLDAPERVRGQRVLDFASGGGVSAVAAAQAGAQVLATEVDGWARACVACCAELNEVTVEVTGRDVIGEDDGWGVVLVGDVFYQEALSRRVLAWLQQLAARGAVVRIGDPGRSFLPQGALVCEGTWPVAPVPAWDSVSDRPARVWRLVAGA
jgi:predicted nicotinamide N-methyase